jgi:hypothetical protein
MVDFGINCCTCSWPNEEKYKNVTKSLLACNPDEITSNDVVSHPPTEWATAVDAPENWKNLMVRHWEQCYGRGIKMKV